MKFSLITVLACALTSAAFAPPEAVVFDHDGNKLPDAEVNSTQVNWELLKLSSSKAFNGIGLVDMGRGGGCTGTFLDTGALANAPAYVLSNGHCVGSHLMGAGDVLVDQPASPGMNFRFNYFVDAGAAVRMVPIRRVVYATMHHTDIAVFELDATYAQLVSEGFVPHVIAMADPVAGTQVEMVGVPQTGVRRATRFVRRSTCQLGERTNLKEGDYSFSGAFRHWCSSVGGSSGSPVIARQSGEIVAINNTGVDDSALSAPECSIDRPCEVARDGSVSTDVKTNYAQKVTDIPSCIDRSGIFDVKVPGCRLEVPQR